VEQTQFPHQEKQPNGNLTISVGVSEVPTHADDASKLVAVADEALYKAKGQGRNTIVVATAYNGYSSSYKPKQVITGPKPN
jgi:diguanylate cyclase (GGDEF)-like protein